MKKILTTLTRTFLGDQLSPITLIAGLRKEYNTTFLLESTDYHSQENAISLIAFDSLSSISVEDATATITEQKESTTTPVDQNIVTLLNDFLHRYRRSGDTSEFNGIYGFSGFDAISYFDTVKLTGKKVDTTPDLCYHHFRYILVLNPFNHQCTLIENRFENEPSHIDAIQERLFAISPANSAIGSFEPLNNETSNMSDDDFITMVQQGKKHIARGDVFQIVLARRFSQSFRGDDLNLYRALRSINPSPYLFYFDFGDYRLMGSSPEAEVIIKDGETQIHPIAGTYRRSGNDEEDQKQAVTLSNDPKEVAEHIMLVDLARNDISRNCENVKVKTFKEIQFFSHVIHLVSNVTGTLAHKDGAIQVFTDTFPAGTLSGAPKFRAVELIDQYEPHKRGFYGGALGYIGYDGQLNHAIMIRSFLSAHNTLHYQAGAGITVNSIDENERDEVYNKLAALTAAIKKAKEL